MIISTRQIFEFCHQIVKAHMIMNKILIKFETLTLRLNVPYFFYLLCFEIEVRPFKIWGKYLLPFTFISFFNKLINPQLSKIRRIIANVCVVSFYFD